MCDFSSNSAIIGDMKDEMAREFWSRVDGKLGTSTLKDLCAKAGINYDSVRNRKSGPVYSLPRIETGYAISKALGVSMEYLLTGEDAGKSPFQEYIPFLEKASEKDLYGVRKLLGMPEKKTGNSGVMAS